MITKGNAIDQDRIIADLVALCGELDLREIAVTAGARSASSLGCKSAACRWRSFGQGFASMSAPCKEIERAILGRQFRIGGDPILRWNITNARVEPDAAGNINFAKHKSVGKIDGAVAVVMAIGRALANEAGPTIYERARPEGFLFV